VDKNKTASHNTYEMYYWYKTRNTEDIRSILTLLGDNVGLGVGFREGALLGLVVGFELGLVVGTYYMDKNETASHKYI